MEPNETVENKITNSMVDAGVVPDSQREDNFQAPDVSTIEGSPAPVATPTITPQVGAIENYTSITPEMLQQRRELATKQKSVEQQGQDLYEGLLGLGTQGRATIEAEDAAGIPGLSTQLVEVENELASKTLQFRRERERIEQGTGLTSSQKNVRLAEVGRVQNRELADLETIRAARSNTLTNAQNLVNRKVELEFGDKIANIKALQFIYDENKQILTKEEDRLLSQTIKREERGFELAKTKFVQLENEKAKYLTNAAQAGADNNTLKTIQAAGSLDDLYSMDGIQQYALSKAEKLSVELQSENLANVREERQARADAAAAREAAIESGEILPEQAEVIDGIDKEFRSEPVVKEYNVAVAKKAGVEAVINSGVKGVEDIALVYEFMKSIDPTSVVRETEFATAANAGNIFQGKMAQFNGYFKEGGGSLPENVSTAFRNSIYQSFAQKESQYYNVKDQFGEKVNRRLGIDNGSTYLTQYDAATSLQIDESGNIVIPGRQENADFFNPNK